MNPTADRSSLPGTTLPMRPTTSPRERSPVRRTILRASLLIVAAGLVVAAVGPVTIPARGAVSTDELRSEPAFIVSLDADGSVRVTLITTFNLSSDSERAAFRRLSTNSSALERRGDRFASRLTHIAGRLEESTGRTMAVRDLAVRSAARGSIGIVALSVTWVGLAESTADRVVLREPFASGFETNRTFRVNGPDGYKLAWATPSPANQDENAVSWRAGTALDGLEVTFVPAEAGQGKLDGWRSTND